MGSVHTVRFARACGVSPDWLDDEIGEMRPETGTADRPSLGTEQARENYKTNVTALPVESPLLKELMDAASRLSEAGLHRLIERAESLRERFSKAQSGPAKSSQ